MKSLWAHPMVLRGDVGHMEPHFSLFENSINLNVR
jgi:hypothetical protein